jgi:hypothetical protein
LINFLEELAQGKSMRAVLVKPLLGLAKKSRRRILSFFHVGESQSR